jgi:hypothetical protein
LRHYPNKWDMDNVSSKCPETFQETMEPLYRMVKQYEQDKDNE